MQMRRARGFTLIEVMIIVVIVAILAAIAIPNYQSYVLRGYRSEGVALLSDAAARQERYYAQNNSYTNDASKLGLPLKSGKARSANERYELAITIAADGSDGGYALEAKRQGAQLKDTDCGNLTLDATGKRGASASGASVAECWR